MSGSLDCMGLWSCMECWEMMVVFLNGISWPNIAISGDMFVATDTALFREC